MPQTEFADYKFTVKEFEPDASGKARTFLACEPMTEEFSYLDGNKGFLSIHLKEGIDVNEAAEIARYLQSKVARFAITKL
jgi:hypothetical protein